MRSATRRRISFEHLENRWCPALTLVALDGAGNLMVAGTPTSDTVTFNFIAQDEIEVLDGATSLGTFSVPGDLRVNLGNKITTNVATGVVVSLDMNGFGLSGNASLTLGNVINQGGGPGGYAVDDGDLGGTISGNLSVTSGAGDDSVTLVFATTIQGNLTFNAGANPLTSLGDVFTVDGGTTVGGNLTGTKVNTFTLGSVPPSTVGGHVTLTADSNGSNFFFFTGSTTDRSAVGGNVILTSTNSALNTDTAIFNGAIGGSLIANMGNGFNFFILDSTSFTLGNFSYVGGSGIDIVNTASGVGTGAVIMGNVSVVAGNGSNNFTMDTGTVIGGSSITFLGGNNTDTLVFNADAPGARLNARLGAGADLFTIGSNNLASAFVDFGAGVDSLVLGVPAISFPVTFRNLP